MDRLMKSYLMKFWTPLLNQEVTSLTRLICIKKDCLRKSSGLGLRNSQEGKRAIEPLNESKLIYLD